MPDLQVIIKILTQELGSEKADQILKRIKAGAEGAGEAQDKAGEKTKLFQRHNEALKKTIQELSREFPIAGMALRAFTNPIAATLTLGTGAFLAIKQHISELNTSLDALESNARQPLSSFATALREMQSAAEEKSLGEAFAGFTQAVGDIKTKADAAVNSIRALEVAQRELVSAREAEELAVINKAEREGTLSPTAAIKERQSTRDRFAREQKDRADAAREEEISVREQEAARIARKRAEVADLALSPSEAMRRGALVKTRNEDAARFRKLADEGKFDERGVEDVGSGKTLDEQIKEKSTKIDELAAAAKRNKAAGIFAPGDAAERAALLKSIDERRGNLLAERDALENRKAGLINTADNAEALSRRYAEQVKASESAAEQVKQLTEQLEALRAQITALREAAGISRTKGEETEATKARTRGVEAETGTIEAAEKEAARAARERKQNGKAAVRSNQSDFKTSDASASFEAGFDDLAAAFAAGQADVIAYVNAKLGDTARAIADTSRRTQDSMLS